jgi:hypothetical protein
MAGFIERNLAPGERLGEVLFGLIMSLTFVLGARIFWEGEAFSARDLLLATVGCNIAWGVIDGVLLVIGRVFDRSRLARLGHLIRKSDDDGALRIVAGELDEALTPISSEPKRLEFYRDVVQRIRSATPSSPRPRAGDWLAAMAVFWLVVLVSMPALLPFLFIEDAFIALRVSNAILISLVFLVGHKWGSATGMSPWGTGLALASLCLVLVLIAIPLGG